jgi:hypothetical protein
MYTTKEFEDAAIRKGFELDHIILTSGRLIRQAAGYVLKDGRKRKMRWDHRGIAICSTGLCPEFNLFQ